MNANPSADEVPDFDKDNFGNIVMRLTPADMAALLPCPFCGEHDLGLYSASRTAPGVETAYYSIRCEVCGAEQSTGQHLSPGKQLAVHQEAKRLAMRNWNRRAPLGNLLVEEAPANPQFIEVAVGEVGEVLLFNPRHIVLASYVRGTTEGQDSMALGITTTEMPAFAAEQLMRQLFLEGATARRLAASLRRRAEVAG